MKHSTNTPQHVLQEKNLASRSHSCMTDHLSDFHSLTLQGKDLGTSTVLRIDQAEKKFVFEGVASKPVPSLLRNFSAPVKMTVLSCASLVCYIAARFSMGFGHLLECGVLCCMMTCTLSCCGSLVQLAKNCEYISLHSFGMYICPSACCLEPSVCQDMADINHKRQINQHSTAQCMI